MNRNRVSAIALILLAAAFLVFTLLNNVWLSGIRLDLTENKLFTLSAGTREITAQIDEPINLYFFFSEKASEDLTTLRAYATRVRELLQEYALLADGKINLQLIDPQPFSDAEDRAAAFGLQSVPVNNAGDELYFGLAGSNALDNLQVISFFQPDKEAFLEYEISKLIQNLLVQKKPKVGLLSSLKVQGDMDMNTFQTTPPWVVVDQIDQSAELEVITPDAEILPTDLDLLILIQPRGLTESLLISIDQFALAGGRILVFLDPMAEMDQSRAAPMLDMVANDADFDLPLLESWGIQLRRDLVLGDAQQALTVSGANGQPVRHLAILGLQTSNFKVDDVTLSSLETINVSTAGILDVLEHRTTEVDVLMSSSEYAMPMDRVRLRMLSDPSELLADFKPTGLLYPVAVRITGPAETHYPAEVGERVTVSNTKNLNVIVVADTDILSDRLWVQLQDFFGQRIVSPWANNGDFVTNAVDNLTGSSALISIRSRGRFSRPFEVVQDLRREAEASYLSSANDLQMQLAETEAQLGQLEASRDEQNLISLSPEQEATLVQFQQEKLRIRKALRDVRHQLNQDIEMLGTTLKFVNIVLMPLLLTLGLLVFNYLRLYQSANRRDP
jgi:ABC-type uncharacterized transport system involved in gliding motility auxiliary subunit